MTETLDSATLLAPELTLANTKGNSCEDCPDINCDPPSDSDCQYFEASGGVPTCTREGNTQRELDRWIGTDIGSVACPNLVAVVEFSQQLPGVYPVQ